MQPLRSLFLFPLVKRLHKERRKKQGLCPDFGKSMEQKNAAWLAQNRASAAIASWAGKNPLRAWGFYGIVSLQHADKRIICPILTAAKHKERS